MTLPYRVHNVVSIDISLIKGIGAHKTTARLIPVPEVVTCSRARARGLSSNAAGPEGEGTSAARGRGLLASRVAPWGDEEEKKEKRMLLAFPRERLRSIGRRLMSIARPRWQIHSGKLCRRRSNESTIARRDERSVDRVYAAEESILTAPRGRRFLSFFDWKSKPRWDGEERERERERGRGETPLVNFRRRGRG